MDTLRFLALQRWSELTNEGILAVEPGGHILLLNAKLRDRLQLQSPPQTVKALLSQVTRSAPGFKRLLTNLHTPREEWGSLQFEGLPTHQLLWERTPLLSGDEMLGTLFIFRDAVTQGQHKLATQSFLGMLSHDLRTPLSTILGFAELWYNNRDTVEPEEQVEFLEHIISNANHLSQYIKIALDVMYLEADLQSFDAEIVSLSRFVKHWVKDASHRLTMQQLALQNGTGNAPLAYASPEALHRILYILMEFALTETPEASTIQLKLSTSDLYAHLTIEHHAPKLRPEDIPNLFRITHPRDLSDAGRPKLHRLQLYVAHLLAERQQGHLTIHEHANQLYTLDLALPLADEDPPHTPENK